VATAGFAWGCSGGPDGASAADSAPADAPPSAATADSPAPDRPVGAAPGAERASYHVPVPLELEPYSHFELGDLRLRARGSDWELEYTLPELLVGGHQSLSFRGSSDGAGDYRLLGEAGQVTCQSLGTSMECSEVLSRVELDREKLQRLLAALPAEESAARWAVAGRFSDDPIGVLTFPAQKR
jgi:hypothetical protein